MALLSPHQICIGLASCSIERLAFTWFRRTQTPTATESQVYSTEAERVLTEAVNRIGGFWHLSNAKLRSILGLSAPTISRLRAGQYRLEQGSKPFELASTSRFRTDFALAPCVALSLRVRPSFAVQGTNRFAGHLLCRGGYRNSSYRGGILATGCVFQLAGFSTTAHANADVRIFGLSACRACTGPDARASC